jgi:hypothetical protein
MQVALRLAVAAYATRIPPMVDRRVVRASSAISAPPRCEVERASRLSLWWQRLILRPAPTTHIPPLILARLIQGQMPPDWSPIESRSYPSGYRATLYVNHRTAGHVIVHQGNDESDARHFMSVIGDDLCSEYVVYHTGHREGGAVAQRVAAPDHRIVVFDAPKASSDAECYTCGSGATIEDCIQWMKTGLWPRTLRV